MRPIFNQDLNGDGTIGLPTHVVQIESACDDTDRGSALSDYFLNPTGGPATGPELEAQGGAVVTAGGSPALWTPIGAVQACRRRLRHRLARHGLRLYSVWSLDSNGNYLSNLINLVAGNNFCAEAIETIFTQDLNGDGTIGFPTHVVQIDGATILTGGRHRLFPASPRAAGQDRS